MNPHLNEIYGQDPNIYNSCNDYAQPNFQQSTDRDQFPEDSTYKLHQRCTNLNTCNPNDQYFTYNSQTSGCNNSKSGLIETRKHEQKGSNSSSYKTSVTSNNWRSSEVHKYNGFQSTHLPSLDGDIQNLTDQRNKINDNVPTQIIDVYDQSPCGPSSLFPDLVLYLSSNPKEKIAILKRAFAESPYGQLDTVTQQTSGNMITVSLVCAGQYLAEGSAKKLKEATIIASCILIEKLQATNYSIVENNSYFSNLKVPSCVLNADPLLKHIYRVVYLENKSKSRFPHSLTGAIDYIQTEDDLWKYVENHCRNVPKADLFILNIEKFHRHKVSELCKIYNMTYKLLNGCSDRGAAVMAKVDLLSLFHELKECGGKHLKYRLIHPGPPGESESDMFKLKTVGSINECANTSNDPDESNNKQDVFKEGKEIVISDWIADNLIIMDVFNKNSVKERPKEILFMSVKDTTAFNEFIVEKKKDGITGKITGSAVIDRILVGGATGYTEETVKMLAAENALTNLKKFCYYIEGKPSYFGINGCKPTFLFSNYPRKSSSIYKIVSPEEVSSKEDLNYIFKQFKSSCFQDLFLLEDIPDIVRELACLLGPCHNLQVRKFDERCICIYKRQRPRVVIKQLLSLDGRENEKYRLHYPLMRAKGTESRKSYSGDPSAISKLFDFKSEYSPVVHYNRSSNEVPGYREPSKIYNGECPAAISKLFDYKTEHYQGPVRQSQNEEPFHRETSKSYCGKSPAPISKLFDFKTEHSQTPVGAAYNRSPNEEPSYRESSKSYIGEGMAAISNPFDLKTEHSHKQKKEPDRDKEYGLMYQGLKRDHSKCEGYSDPSENKLWDSEDLHHLYKNTRPRYRY